MKIMIAGEGGQGVQLVAEILAYAAFLQKKESSLIPNFGVEQRGGVSIAFILVDEDPSYPKFNKADILAILCDRTIERVQQYIGSKTKVIYGPAVTQQKAISDKGLPNKVWNMLVLGKIIEESNVLQKSEIKEALEKKLDDKFQKDPQLKEMNFKALT